MLYIVPTPIGNLEDITLRALRLLKEAQLILCEDSRQTRKLMNLLEIENKPKFVDLVRNQEYNFRGVQEAISQLENDPDLVVLLVSDAGTPGISDPGFEVLRMVQQKNIKYTVLPGATAFVPALVASNLVSKEFRFVGFLPLKKGRQTLWKEIIRSQTPIIIYESVHRILKFIEEAKSNLEPERKICICRELTKTFEEIWVGNIAGLSELKIIEKGEFVIIISSAQ